MEIKITILACMFIPNFKAIVKSIKVQNSMASCLDISVWTERLTSRLILLIVHVIMEVYIHQCI